jgi:quinol monooxygenase YgiN
MMAVSEMLRMYARDGVGDELEKAADSGLHLFTDDPGCLQVELYRRVDDPSCFILKADWESIDAHKAWAATDALAQWRALLGDLRDDRTEPLGDYTQVSRRS